MYSPEDYPRSTVACGAAKFEAAKCIRGVNSDADHIAGLEPMRIKALQSFVSNQRVAIAGWRRCGDDVQPPRRDHSNAEGDIARVYQMNADRNLLVCPVARDRSPYKK